MTISLILATFLGLESQNLLFCVALVVATAPWFFLFKLKNGARHLIRLDDTAAMSTSGPAAKGPLESLPGAQPENSLLVFLQQAQTRGDKETIQPDDRWDLEVIVPAYNEELNIESCVQSFVDSAIHLYDQHRLRTRLIVVDDKSTDQTHARVAACQEKLARLLDERSKGLPSKNTARSVALTLLTSPTRPSNQMWFGKNWACHTGFLESRSECLFFVDADVTVQKPFLAAFANRIGSAFQFVGFVPTLVCKSLVDFIVLPNVAISAFGINNLSAALEPDSKKPHAMGQCVFISRKAYLATGGYQTANDDSLETRGLETKALATNILRAGMRATNVVGGDLIHVYMYHDTTSLWEGLTKNFFMAVNRSVGNAIFSMALILLLFDIPLLLLLSSQTAMLVLWYVAGHLAIRVVAARDYNVSVRGWFLFPLSGLALTMIMIGSAYKVLSGQSWTWKGRSLSLHTNTPKHAP